jgi:hypothetical protein
MAYVETRGVGLTTGDLRLDYTHQVSPCRAFSYAFFYHERLKPELYIVLFFKEGATDLAIVMEKLQWPAALYVNPC